jgi:hypothetical protein
MTAWPTRSLFLDSSQFIFNMQYVLLKGSFHGLANRLFVLSTAISICKKTGAKLIVDWNDDIYGVPFWEAFSLENCNHILAPDQRPHILNGLASSQTAWQGQYEANVNHVKCQLSNHAEYYGLDLQDIPPLSGLKTYFDGQPQKEVMVLCGYQKRGQARIQLLRHLYLSPLWHDGLLADMANISDHLKYGAYVGLHIRGAAGGHFPTFKRESLISHLHKNPSLRLFVSTDLVEIEVEMRHLFGSRLICIDRTYATTPSQCKIEPFALHRMSSPDKLDSGLLLREALRDLCILSRSHTIFAQPYSTFSELACLFSTVPPWRLRFNADASVKYRLGSAVRGFIKYQCKRSSLLG